MKVIKLFPFLVVMILLVTLAMPVAAAPPQENPGEMTP